MANEGFIKLYRKMLEWGWYDDGPTKDVFIHLLLIASYEDKFYRGIPLERGQVVTTVTGLALALGFTSRQALLNYQNKPEFVDTITRAKTLCEQYAEERLYDKDGSGGAQFSLRANFGWQDKPEQQQDSEVLIIDDL